MVFAPGEKSGNEQEEVALQNASKQIVQTAILQAVQQVSQESQQQEKKVNSSLAFRYQWSEDAFYTRQEMILPLPQMNFYNTGHNEHKL
ncbi:unnamed protein product [Caretta caretta]